MRAHRGASGLFILVVIALAMIVVLAAGVLFRVKTNSDDATQSRATLKKAATALEQFAGSSGRLPCPADPSKDEGLASPLSASRDCDFAQGTLPWATIGMRRDDAYDAWGWKISYRVYSNTDGSLTQDKGASMVDCDTNPTLGSSGVDGKKLCRATHATIPSEFISGKGWPIHDFGTLINGGSASGGAAYVLISHGPTGLGAWTSAGVQKDQPKSSEEKDNLKAGGDFWILVASPPDIPADANTHFDDILVYRTVSDLAKQANLVARDWPDDFASMKFDSNTLAAALGQTGSPSQGSLGTSTARFNNAMVTSQSGNISYDVRGGIEGIGVAGGGGSTANELSGSEGLTIKFSKAANKLGITLNDFGGTSIGPFFFPESAQIQFYSNGTPVGTAVTIQGCQSSVPSGGPLASYTISPGVSFDQFQINAGLLANFTLSAIQTCASTSPTCFTSLDTGASPPVGNHCP